MSEEPWIDKGTGDLKVKANSPNGASLGQAIVEPIAVLEKLLKSRFGNQPALKFVHPPREYRWLNERGRRSAGSGVACHRALKVPKDDFARVMLLEALASFKATPLDSFPTKFSTWSADRVIKPML